jgi:hypothetical protein
MAEAFTEEPRKLRKATIIKSENKALVNINSPQINLSPKKFKNPN